MREGCSNQTHCCNMPGHPRYPSAAIKMDALHRCLELGEGANALLERLNLIDAQNRKLSAYSTGMRQRLSLACAMISSGVKVWVKASHMPGGDIYHISAEVQTMEEAQQCAVFLIFPIIALVIGQFTGGLMVGSWLLLGLGVILALLAVLLMKGSDGEFTYEKLLR